MRILLQKVQEASVTVDGKVVGSIEKGILVLYGVHTDDTEDKISYLAKKLCNLRIFEDENEKMNRSLIDVSGELLIVSQFTLYGDCQKGLRPSFIQAGAPEFAEKMYEKFIEEAKGLVSKVETGVFGAKMAVHLINDGPVTLLLER